MSKRFIRRILSELGWIHCPNCNAFILPRYVQDWIYHPEEPPMFYHYECPKCYARTDTKPSLLTERTVRSLGFNSFDDFNEQCKKVSERGWKEYFYHGE